MGEAGEGGEEGESAWIVVWYSLEPCEGMPGESRGVWKVERAEKGRGKENRPFSLVVTRPDAPRLAQARKILVKGYTESEPLKVDEKGRTAVNALSFLELRQLRLRVVERLDWLRRRRRFISRRGTFRSVKKRREEGKKGVEVHLDTPSKSKRRKKKKILSRNKLSNSLRR